jgi:hypothetical protein
VTSYGIRPSIGKNSKIVVVVSKAKPCLSRLLPDLIETMAHARPVIEIPAVSFIEIRAYDELLTQFARSLNSDGKVSFELGIAYVAARHRACGSSFPGQDRRCFRL